MQQLSELSTLLPAMLLIGFLTESVVEMIKQFVDTKMKSHHIYIIAFVVSFVLCCALDISLFTTSNMGAHYVGIPICALVASRGSNFVHNWLDTLPMKK